MVSVTKLVLAMIHVSKIISGPRHGQGRAVKRAKTTTAMRKADHVDGMEARNELDTRADTICAGVNFRMISTSGQCCDVKGFHEEFESIKDVPVARVATKIITPQGETLILIVNEALYFGPSMDHSLINPNQIRHYGIPVCDNPYER